MKQKTNKMLIFTSLAAYFTYFIHGIGASILGQYKPEFAAAWGAKTLADGTLDVSMVVSVIAALGLGRLISLPFSGPLSDKYGRRLSGIIGVLCYVAYFFGMANSTSMAMGYAFAVIGGIANSFLDTCVSPTCMEIYVNNPSVANLFTKFSICLSQFLLPFLIGIVASANMSYKTIFIVAGIAIFIDGILILILPFPERKKAAEAKEDKKKSGHKISPAAIAAILIGLVVSVLCGMWNGFLVANMKIQPMVATLILFTAGRGMAQLITGGNNLYVKVDSFKYLGGFLPHIPVPTPILVAIIVVILATLFLNKTATKLYIESVGINPRASRLFGLNSTKIIFITYAACGLCAGIAGMIATSRITSIDANNVGNLMELDAILAVALGGNSLAGGKFSVAGSVIGAITIQALSTTLYAMKVTGDQLPLYKAIVVIIIVTLQSPEFKKYLNRIKAKRAAKTAGEKVA